MSDNNPHFNSDVFKTNGDWTHQGSQNAGTWESQNGRTCSPQQHNESWISYTTRQAAYSYNEGLKNN